MASQALDWERLGPERKPYSERRRRRLAVQEASTALLATLQVMELRAPACRRCGKAQMAPGANDCAHCFLDTWGTAVP